MAHDVFISHSARDKPIADAVCAKLESRGIRCWIAPRDIAPGMEWGAAIISAIDHARVMLLVFSANANSSPQISREVERAVSKGLIVMPVRVEDVKPAGNLEYFLGTPHWLDAITPPFENHLDRIADSAKFWFEQLKTDLATPATPPPTTAAPGQSAPARDESRVAPIPAPTPAPTAIAPAPSHPKWIVPAIVVAIFGAAAFFGARYAVAPKQVAREQPAQPSAAATSPNQANAAAPQPNAMPASRESLAPGREFRDCGVCPEMVVIPAGSFTMGSPQSEPGRLPDEGPQHNVTIGYPLAVAKFPVMRHQYARFASETARASNQWQNAGFRQTPKDPVVKVSWDDAKAYVAWLSKKTGHSYRLLSESEFEYASRAGTTTAYWWGNDAGDVCSHANARECGHDGTVPVGSYPANAFGLHDTAGNVWQWTEDCWNASYAGAPADGTARTAANCEQHVIRGGSWAFVGKHLRSASRARNFTNARVFGVGFRVARTL
jgi:formylglycine-generating enzyme required for sulfatase activity